MSLLELIMIHLFANMNLFVNTTSQVTFLIEILFTLMHLAHHIGILEMIFLHILMEGKDMSILMPSVICVHFSQL